MTGGGDAAFIQEKLGYLGYPVQGHNSLTSKAKSFVSFATGRMTRG